MQYPLDMSQRLSLCRPDRLRHIYQRLGRKARMRAASGLDVPVALIEGA